MLAVFILYEFGALLPVFLTFACTLLIAVCHALARPVVNEIYFLHHARAHMDQRRRTVAYKDKVGGGGDDQEEGDDELTFTPVEKLNSDGVRDLDG